MELKAMNARVGNVHLLENKEYLFEPKLDGFRALCFINKTVRFISRNGLDMTDHYPTLQEIKKLTHAHSCVFDGEIIALDDKGMPRFELLQEGKPEIYCVFDILMKDNKILTHLPLIERKAILEKTLNDGTYIKKILFTTKGEALWKEMNERKGEGVMAKEINGLYYSGQRTATWLKIKIHNTLDCVIVGYGAKKRQLSSLALGLYDNYKKLHYIGNVGTGFSEQLIMDLLKLLEPLRINYNPTITQEVKEGIQFVKPHLTCEVKYEELTKQQIVRQAAFVRLRPDKKPEQCTFESQV
ncbi:MAG: non-homologous end-joining DNA ligase [Candidatus Babeliaceae bacterium]